MLSPHGLCSRILPQAAAAVNTLNGTDLGGRPISVREDREDRDIKDYQRENGIERPARPPPRLNGRGRGGRGRGRGPPPPPSGKPEQSSGLQVVVHGLPWAFTSEQLQELFEDSGNIEKAEVIYGRDNRSRVWVVGGCMRWCVCLCVLVDQHLFDVLLCGTSSTHHHVPTPSSRQHHIPPTL